MKDAFLDRVFGRTLKQFSSGEIHFGREKAEHANAPNGTEYWEACTVHARAASGGVQGRKDGRPGGGVQRG